MRADRAAISCLERAAVLLAQRAGQLEERVRQGDGGTWAEYRETLNTLAGVLNHLAPGRRGELLTTAEMAKRLNVTPKTLLKRKAQGDIRPVLERGKFIRWRGTEGLER